jgi:hypothetical protein
LIIYLGMGFSGWALKITKTLAVEADLPADRKLIK